MKEIAILTFHVEYTDCYDMRGDLCDAITDWSEVSDDEYDLLERYLYRLQRRNNGRYLLLERVDKELSETKSYLPQLISECLKLAEKDKKAAEAEQKKKEEAKLKRDKKKQENERKKFEELKKKFGNEQKETT